MQTRWHIDFQMHFFLPRCQYSLAQFVACEDGRQLERRLLSSIARGSNGKWQTKARLCRVTDGVGWTGKQREPTNGCGEIDCEGCCERGGGGGGYCSGNSHARAVFHSLKCCRQIDTSPLRIFTISFYISELIREKLLFQWIIQIDWKKQKTS